MVKRLTKKGSRSLNDDFAEACVKKCLLGSPFDNLNLTNVSCQESLKKQNRFDDLLGLETQVMYVRGLAFFGPSTGGPFCGLVACSRHKNPVPLWFDA